LTTPHGVIFTPAFMPVGTYGAVKGISPDELAAAGADIILSNALHLEFRPGSHTIARLGGLHRLMGWRGPILTDSGGFQTYSLAAFTKQKDEALEIRSPVEGSKHRLTPETVIEIQRRLGTDFMMPLDVCAPGDSDRKTVIKALEQTLRWADRTREAYDHTQPVHSHPQAPFGIIQGGVHEDLRERAVRHLLELGFFAYSLGGLAVGESRADRRRIVAFCDEILPRDHLRYLMGVGTPEDLEEAVSLGMDLFDCVMPTRNGRKGSVFVREGKINLRNAAFRDDPRALEESCTCYACVRQPDGLPRFSRGAIRHLLSVNDPLGARLGALHNLAFYLRLMADLRGRIAGNAALIWAPRPLEASRSTPIGGDSLHPL
jgi:queuine tRNA-ribosyltransferase